MDNKIRFETEFLYFCISSDGLNLEFTDKKTGRNVLDMNDRYFSKLILDDFSQVKPIKVLYDPPFLYVTYENHAQAVIRAAENCNYLTFELIGVNCDKLRSVTFVQISVDINYSTDCSFIASCMGMSLNTRMREYPGRNTRLICESFPHIGMTGAKCAIIGAPEALILGIMKEVVNEIPDGTIPKGLYSGPYASSCCDAARTYTIGGVSSVDKVDEYVNDLKQFGISQVNMHQGVLYRQGDFKVTCENGRNGLKAMINRYHELGIQVILHTYSFFIGNWSEKVGNKYLAPIPHKDLGVCARFTLDHDISSSADTIPVTEPTVNVKESFGYNEPASPILWVDNELIRFHTVNKTEPFGFKKCERGSLGTIASEHKKGAEVRQLNSYFGFIAPHKNSELFFEIAKNTADFYNEFDFDGFYLDAIDGVFVLDGNEFSWYHSVTFINEMFKHLKKPPVFNCCYGPQYPGQWYARTRMGAFDSPTRGYRDFIDAHITFNEKYAERMYMISELGWLSLYPQTSDYLGCQEKIIFDEDLEYICSKMLATDACQCWHENFSLYKDIPVIAGYRDKIMLYTKLKESGYFSEKVKDIVRRPASEFDLIMTGTGDYKFRHTETFRKCIESFEDGRNIFTVYNKYHAQKPKLRIEALYTAENYDSENAIPVLTLDKNTAIKLGRTYDIGDLDLSAKRGICIRIFGDGKGETVNIRFRSPEHIAFGYADHFVKIDFTGWRCFTFFESQNCEMPHDDWAPKQMEYNVYTDVYSFYAVYSFNIDFRHIAYIDILVNKPGDYEVRMDTIKAVPHHELALKNPSVSIDGKCISFKTTMISNTFLEYSPYDGSCAVYDLAGNIIDTPDVTGDMPVLENGDNRIRFWANCTAPYQKRAAVTIRTVGDPVY